LNCGINGRIPQPANSPPPGSGRPLPCEEARLRSWLR
jgi:hypothetical protein